jgi:hypothetical protein
LKLAPGNSIVSVVVLIGRHTRSTPQLPLVTPEADPKKIIRKGKTPQEGIATVVAGDSSKLHDSYLKTPVVASNYPVIPSIGVPKSLNFESFPIYFSPPSLGLEGERFDTTFSLEFIK